MAFSRTAQYIMTPFCSHKKFKYARPGQLDFAGNNLTRAQRHRPRALSIGLDKAKRKTWRISIGEIGHERAVESKSRERHQDSSSSFVPDSIEFRTLMCIEILAPYRYM